MGKAILRMAGARAVISYREENFPALIGKNGIRAEKSEGDLCTPIGELPLRRILYRADRTARPVSSANLPIEPIAPDDGWCDDPTSPCYNQGVLLPYSGSSESLWREDNVYDLCIVMGWNDGPVVPNRGSAIFLHLPPASGYTEGCIALEEVILRRLLAEGLTHVTVLPAAS